jgi:hypothetical protein
LTTEIRGRVRAAAAAAVLSLLVSTSIHAAALSLVGTIPLRGVEGRIDHLSIDPAGHRLFVSALGSSSIKVIGLETGSVLRSLEGFSEPQGVLYVRELNKLYVTNAGNGECDVLDGSTYVILKRIPLREDADNLHYESTTRRMYVSAGSRLVVLDAVEDRQRGVIELPGHPEGFVLEQGGPRIFVNIPSPGRGVFVVERTTSSITARWAIGGAAFPAALDETSGRLFVGTRDPASLEILDVSSGRSIGRAATDGDSDDVWFDRERGRVYVSCGEGFVDVFQQDGSGPVVEKERVPTAAGARTSLWVPDLRRLFVAVPHRGAQAAEIRVYAVD